MMNWIYEYWFLMIKFCSFNRKYINRKRFIFLFHSLSISTPSPSHPILWICFLSMYASLSLSLPLSRSRDIFPFARTHAILLSIYMISVICPSLFVIVVVTFDVDMLRQSLQLALTSIYTIWLYLERWCVRLLYFCHFSSLFVQCSNKNHNHFGKIECILVPFSRFSLAQPLRVCLWLVVFFHLNFNWKAK